MSELLVSNRCFYHDSGVSKTVPTSNSSHSVALAGDYGMKKLWAANSNTTTGAITGGRSIRLNLKKSS